MIDCEGLYYWNDMEEISCGWRSGEGGEGNSRSFGTVPQNNKINLKKFFK